MDICPCKNCVPPTRCVGCHSVCNDYIKWREEQDDILNKRKADAEVESAIKSLMMRT